MHCGLVIPKNETFVPLGAVFISLDHFLERPGKINALLHNMVTIDEASKQASNQCTGGSHIHLMYTDYFKPISGVWLYQLFTWCKLLGFYLDYLDYLDCLWHSINWVECRFLGVISEVYICFLVFPLIPVRDENKILTCYLKISFNFEKYITSS